MPRAGPTVAQRILKAVMEVTGSDTKDLDDCWHGTDATCPRTYGPSCVSRTSPAGV